MNNFEIVKFDEDKHRALIEPLTELLHAAYRPLAEKGMRYLATHQPPETTLRRLKKGDLFLGFIDGELVSTITVVKNDPSEKCTWYQKPEVFFFSQFAVKPTYQGLGLGRKLMDFVENYATAEGAEEMALDTSEHAHHLISIYKNRGYRFVEYAQWEVTNYRSVILSKTLNGLVVEQLSTHNWKSFEKLFSDCKQCRECWCLNHRVPSNEVVTGENAKAKMKSMTTEGKVGGLLGFIGNDCVAWISVDPIDTQFGHDYVIERGSSGHAGAWAIHCVYLAPAHRGKGLSRPLIEKAIAFAKGKGAKTIMAFPIPSGTRSKFPKDDAEFSGRFSTFKNAGFVEGETLNAFYQVMELSLEGQ